MAKYGSSPPRDCIVIPERGTMLRRSILVMKTAFVLSLKTILKPSGLPVRFMGFLSSLLAVN